MLWKQLKGEIIENQYREEHALIIPFSMPSMECAGELAWGVFCAQWPCFQCCAGPRMAGDYLMESG